MSQLANVLDSCRKPTWTVGRYASLRYVPPELTLESPAAVDFTTGSTGPPKGVLYTHRTSTAKSINWSLTMRSNPVAKILWISTVRFVQCSVGYDNSSTDMDPTRPADVEPPRLLMLSINGRSIRHLVHQLYGPLWGVTQTRAAAKCPACNVSFRPAHPCRHMYLK